MLSPLSKKKLAAIKSGAVKLQGRSSFRRPSIEEMKAKDKADREEYYGVLPKRIEFKSNMTAEEYRAYVRQQAAPAIERLRARGLKKKSPRQIAKERALAQFSRFIRLRDANAEGLVKCCTCPAVKPWRKMQAGHYVTTAKEATKFDENNVHGQCSGCNRWQNGKSIEHEQFIERKYGKGTAEQIRIKSVMECKRNIDAYRAIEEAYRLKAKEIEMNEPLKYYAGNDRVQLT